MLTSLQTWTKALAFVLLILWVRKSSAQSERGGIEAAPMRLAPRSGDFVSTRIARAGPGTEIATRISYLDRPISVVAASASADGSNSQVVFGALLLEMGLSHAFRGGWDVGLAWGAHLYQWGAGDTLVEGVNSPLPTSGLMNPLLELGHSFQLASLWLRPFGAIYLPLGTPKAYAAERRTRFEAGASATQQLGFFRWSLELSALYRPVVELSTTRWGTQAKLALAADFAFGLGLYLGPELLLRPVLTPQKSGSASTIVPADALLKLSYERERVSCRLAYGMGLPLSRVENEIRKDQKLFRAPSTPVSHGLLECSLSFGERSRPAAPEKAHD